MADEETIVAFVMNFRSWLVADNAQSASVSAAIDPPSTAPTSTSLT